MLTSSGHTIKSCHILFVELNDLHVVGDSLRGDGFGEDNDVSADGPGDKDCGSGDTVFVGNGLEIGVGVEWGGGRSERRVCLKLDTVLLAVLLQVMLGAVRVELDLG